MKVMEQGRITREEIEQKNKPMKVYFSRTPGGEAVEIKIS